MLNASRKLESLILAKCREMSKGRDRVIGMRNMLDECIVLYLDTHSPARLEHDMYRDDEATGWNPAVVLFSGATWVDVANAMKL